MAPIGEQPCVRRVATVTLSENDTPEKPPSITPSATCRFCRRELVSPPTRNPLSTLPASLFTSSATSRL
ncbi:hypothetical protein D3C83_33120 [compost metagenome]